MVSRVMQNSMEQQQNSKGMGEEPNNYYTYYT